MSYSFVTTLKFLFPDKNANTTVSLCIAQQFHEFLNEKNLTIINGNLNIVKKDTEKKIVKLLKAALINTEDVQKT